MIKFFRRIRQKLVAENRFSKYLLYAIGEIILVVIGILIALQINNNNENRKAKAKERVLIEQLLNDFKKNQEGIDYYQKRYDRNDKYIDVILRHTGPKVNVPSAKVFDSIQGLNTPNVEILYTSDEAQSTLPLDLITNNDLKQAIKGFPIVYKLYDANETGLDKLILQQRKIHQRYVPLIAHEADVYKQEYFEVDTLGLLRNMEFQNITVDRLWVSNSAKNTLQNVKTYNDSIVKLLEVELKKHD